MAESIAILFKTVTWDDLKKDLSQLAESDSSENWVFPSNGASYTLRLYEYDSWLNECEELDVSKINALLGGVPKTILCVELRRSNQNTACDDARQLCHILLNKHKGAVDDALEKIWAAEEIKEDLNFLHEYRLGSRLSEAASEDD